MKLVHLITQNNTFFSLTSNTKNEVLSELVDLFSQTNQFSYSEKLLQLLLDREDLNTTGIGNGIAIPHSRTSLIKKSELIVARSEKGIEFEALDQKPVFLFFLFVSPESENKNYLQLLSEIAKFAKKTDSIQEILNSKTPQEFYSLLFQHCS